MSLASVLSKSCTRIAALALVVCCASGVAADLPKGLSAPPKPTAMPAFDLPTTAGGALHSESLRGQVVIVRYWASW
jgi:hypothetical protein